MEVVDRPDVLVMPEILDVVVHGDVALGDLSRPVCGSVVTDQDLRALARLAEQGVERARQRGLPVVDRNAYCQHRGGFRKRCWEFGLQATLRIVL